MSNRPLTLAFLSFLALQTGVQAAPKPRAKRPNASAKRVKPRPQAQRIQTRRVPTQRSRRVVSPSANSTRTTPNAVTPNTTTQDNTTPQSAGNRNAPAQPTGDTNPPVATGTQPSNVGDLPTPDIVTGQDTSRDPLTNLTPGSQINPETPTPGTNLDEEPTSGLADARLQNNAVAPVFTLTDALAIALRDNPQRRAAFAAVTAARARVGTARAGGRFTAGASASVQQQSFFGPRGAQNNFGGGNGGNGEGEEGGTFTRNADRTPRSQNVNINGELPITTGGRVRSSTRVSQFNLQAQEAQRAQVEQDLILNTTTAFLNVLRTQQLLDVSETNLSVSRERLRVARVRFSAGASARLDVLRAETDYSNARQLRIQAANNLGQSAANLNTLLGRSPETPLRVQNITTLTLPADLPLFATPAAQAVGGTGNGTGATGTGGATTPAQTATAPGVTAPAQTNPANPGGGTTTASPGNNQGGIGGNTVPAPAPNLPTQGGTTVAPGTTTPGATGTTSPGGTTTPGTVGVSPGANTTTPGTTTQSPGAVSPGTTTGTGAFGQGGVGGVTTPATATTGSVSPSASGVTATPGGVSNIASGASAALARGAGATRQSLAVTQAQIRAAEENVRLAQSQRRPSLSLNPGLLLSNPASFLGRFAASIGLSASQTLFSGGRIASQVAEARATVDQLRNNYNDQVLQVANSIESSLLTLDSSQRRLGDADLAVASAREAVRAAQLGFEAGARTALDVSDAQAALLTSQTEAVNARYDVATAQANLAAAIGVLPTQAQIALEAQQGFEAARANAENNGKPRRKRRRFLGIF